MPQLTRENRPPARNRSGDFGYGRVSAADQQAGLAALVSLARQLAGEDAAPPPGALAPRTTARPPAWLRSDAPPWAGGLPDIARITSPERSRASSPGRHGELAHRRLIDTGALALHVKQLARGRIEKVSRHGPVISRQAPRRTLRGSTFKPMLRPADRIVIAFLSLCWAVCLVDFWIWWLEPAHRTTIYGAVLNAVVLGYLTCFPVFFVVVINRLRNVSRSVAVPLLRVAFIVTRAPSEPWEVARATLVAMLNQDFPVPYDVWLADESPTGEILQWCSANGVIVSSRNGVGAYHRPTWPRRTKCKEGNLAYFYDHWGYRSYDVVAQLDCDHKPSPTYLAEMVRPFSDPAVGYVAAPSVCDSNAAESWSARGRLYAEATFHGAFQLGHSAGWSPLCIGSHYAVRTAALRDIGGIGPELAEDFSTTFLMNTARWHGVYAIDAEAHGDGPNTFAAMLVQEFQWSKSLFIVLLRLVPRNLLRLDWPRRFRFLYALFYYLLLTTCTLGGMLLAPIAAITGKPWMNVNYAAFLLHWWSLSVWLILLALVLRRRGLLRPVNAPLVSWENWLYMLVRWPYIARGICAGMRQAVRPTLDNIKVTPKGKGGLESLPTKLMIPYLLISGVYSASALIGEWRDPAAGYVFLCIVGASLYSLVSVLVPILHAREMAVRMNVKKTFAFRKASLVPTFFGILAVIPVLLAVARYPEYTEHVFRMNWSMLLSRAYRNTRSIF